MPNDTLTQNLFQELCRIPLIDPHSHIDPHHPVSKSLADILGYHYYTELAHSAGMPKHHLAANVDPREQVRAILSFMDRFDNTVQYSWFLDIARTFFGFEGNRITSNDADTLWDLAAKKLAQPDWESQVLRQSNLEKVFLTNEFDDPLEGFDLDRYIPCLRTDALVFQLEQPEIRQRLGQATKVEVGDIAPCARPCVPCLSISHATEPGPVPFHCLLILLRWPSQMRKSNGLLAAPPSMTPGTEPCAPAVCFGSWPSVAGTLGSPSIL